MMYEVRHVTTYRYEALVASSRCAVRLLPRLGTAAARPFPRDLGLLERLSPGGRQQQPRQQGAEQRRRRHVDATRSDTPFFSALVRARAPPMGLAPSSPS